MADKKFKVSASSLQELEKIIDGYSHVGSNASLDDISKLAGVGRTVVSSANAFLKETGIIEGGKAKTATPLGRNLGRAIHHNQTQDIKKYWQEVALLYGDSKRHNEP